MYTLLKQLRKLFKIMVSETAPLSIALGFGIGLYLGLTPLLSAHTILLVALLMVFRINMSAAFCAMAIFKLIGMPLWPTFHRLGVSLLEDPSPSVRYAAVGALQSYPAALEALEARQEEDPTIQRLLQAAVKRHRARR